MHYLACAVRLRKMAEAADQVNPGLAASLKDARDSTNLVLSRLNDQMARIQGESCATRRRPNASLSALCVCPTRASSRRVPSPSPEPELQPPTVHRMWYDAWAVGVSACACGTFATRVSVS